MCFEQPISKTEYQLYRIRSRCSAHWRTESLPNVMRKSSNDGVSERREESLSEQMVGDVLRQKLDYTLDGSRLYSVYPE